MPSHYHTELHIEPGTETKIYISPSLFLTSRNIHHWPPTQRGCYFSKEKSLYFYKIYSENNCDYECKAMKEFKKCGCSAYYHPSKNYFYLILIQKYFSCINPLSVVSIIMYIYVVRSTIQRFVGSSIKINHSQSLVTIKVDYSFLSRPRVGSPLPSSLSKWKISILLCKVHCKVSLYDVTLKVAFSLHSLTV